MPTPALTVLLPCRNAAASLDDALASIAVQTFTAFEVIAVDDGSDDATPELLGAWKAKDGRIRTVRTVFQGIAAALETASAHARGPLLARMDADDIAAPRRFERQVALLDAHADLAGCGTRIRYFPRESVRDGALRYERWINSVVTPAEIERDLFVECPIPHPSLVMRRDVYDRVGGYRDTEWPEDYDLIMRIVEAGHRLGKVPEILLEWREGLDRLSRTNPRYAPEAFCRCKAHYLRRRLAGQTVVVWGAGPVGKAFARALASERQPVAAFVDLDPRKIGQTIHGAPVIPPSGIDAFRSSYFVAAVGAADAREEIRTSLRAAGFREPEDFCAVA